MLVGVVDSGVLLPAAAEIPAAWDKLMGDGLFLKTREPLRCLGASLGSLTSGEEMQGPERTVEQDFILKLTIYIENSSGFWSCGLSFNIMFIISEWT